MTDNENLNEHFDDGKVKCEVCGEKFGTISPQHLKKHNLTTAEYKRLYPDAKMAGSAFSKKQKYKNTKLFNDEKKEDNIEDDKSKSVKDIEDNLPLPDDEDDDDNIIEFEFDDELFTDDDVNDNEYLDLQKISKNENLSKEQVKQNFNEKFKHITLDHKRNVAKYLYENLPDIVSDYFIRVYDNNGLMLNRYITDFADPTNKIAFFFPNVYWHNQETPSIEDKYKILKEKGWRVIEISGKDVVDSLREMFGDD